MADDDESALDGAPDNDVPGDDTRAERAAFDVDAAGFDLLRAAALLPRVDGRAVDVEAVLARADALAARVQERRAALGTVTAPLRALLEVMFLQEGYRGDQAAYDAPKNSFLDEVMERRRGLPIALSVLLVEVARRAQVNAFGLAFPGHFMAGVVVEKGKDSDLFFVDAFHGGRVLAPDEVADQLRIPLDVLAPLVTPAPPRTILQRMLTNLRGSYLRRGDDEGQARVLSRLVLLDPNNAELLLERAELRARLLDYDGARKDAAAARDRYGNKPRGAAAERFVEELNKSERTLN